MVQQSLRMLKILRVPCYSRTTYFQHQSQYLEPTVIQEWREEQQAVVEELSELEEGLVVAGDGRCDSPGHCAKYGSYTLIDCRINKVVTMELVQSTEVKNSAWCEIEGFLRALKFFADHGLDVAELVTDRHKSIAKIVREQHPAIKHWNDVWHSAKGLRKQLQILAKKFPQVADWKQSIINHLYWVAASTSDGNGDLKEAKWLSLLDHLQDDHTNCWHDPLEGEERDKEWMDFATVQYFELQTLLTKDNLMKDVRNLSPKYQTSHLEAFHSLVIRFAPKHTAFSYLGMYCRLLLAVLHYNENSGKKQATTKAGQARWAVRFRKANQGVATVSKIHESATYGYTEKLMARLFTGYSQDPAALSAYINDLRSKVPAPLSSKHQQVDKPVIVGEYETRFSDLTMQ